MMLQMVFSKSKKKLNFSNCMWKGRQNMYCVRSYCLILPAKGYLSTDSVPISPHSSMSYFKTEEFKQ